MLLCLLVESDFFGVILGTHDQQQVTSRCSYQEIRVQNDLVSKHPYRVCTQVAHSCREAVPADLLEVCPKWKAKRVVCSFLQVAVLYGPKCATDEASQALNVYPWSSMRYSCIYSE